jgi:opacity protein-like surface antigen
MKYTTLVSTLAVLCVSAALAAGPVHAQETSAPKKEERNVRGIYGGVGAGVGIFDDPSDVEDAWRLQTWFRPFNWVSFELGYIDAGDPSDEIEDADGIHLAVVPTLALADSGIDLFGKVGGFFWEDDNVAVGLGAAYHLPYNLGLRMDWDLLNADDGDNVNVVTLSLFYHLSKMGK